MSLPRTRTIVLDAGPLGRLTNPVRSPAAQETNRWLQGLVLRGNRIVVPAVADYEVRRELVRTDRSRSIQRLDAFNRGRYLPLTDEALLLAATLWAQARNQGMPTGDPRELDCDVLIAAQALGLGTPGGGGGGGNDQRRAPVSVRRRRALEYPVLTGSELARARPAWVAPVGPSTAAYRSSVSVTRSTRSRPAWLNR